MGPYAVPGGKPVGPYGAPKRSGGLKRRVLDPHFALGPPGHVSAKSISGQRGINIHDIQTALKNRGYDVGLVDGIAGPRTLHALSYYNMGVKPGQVAAVQARATSPEADLHHGHSQGIPLAQAPAHIQHKVAAAKSAAVKTTHSGSFSGGAGSGGGGSLPNIGDGNVGSPLTPGYADAVAGLQYDPTIHDLGLQKARQPAQAAQDLADIKNFYAQVMGHQKTAGVRDAAIEQAGQGSMQDAVQAILGSIGGAANTGSSTVAASGADALGTLKALAQNNDQYNNDMAPLLAAEGAAAGTREIHSQDAQAQDIATKLQDALGARGQAKAKAMGDVTQSNNALAQQRFQNRVALLNTVGAAQLAGLKTKDMLANINYKKARTAAVGKTGNKNGWKPWLQMPGDQRMAAIDANLKPYVGTYGELLPNTDPNMVANQLRAALRSQGFSSARRLGFKGGGVDPRAQQSILEGIHTALQQAVGRRAYAAAQTAGSK